MRWMLWVVVLIGFSWTTTDEVRIKVETTGCGEIDSVFVYEFNGLSFDLLQGSPMTDDQSMIILPATEPRFYYVGTSAENVRPVLAGSEPILTLAVPNCRQFRYGVIEESELNAAYEALKNRINTFKTTSNTLSQQYRQMANNPEGQELIVAQMEVVDNQKLSLLDSLRSADPYMANVFELNTYLFYPIHGSEFSNEIDYFATNYFQFVDWTDASLGYNPWVFEAWKAYAETLSRIGINAERHKAFLESSLEAIPMDRRSRQLALGGTLVSLQQTQHPNYAHFAQLFVDGYGEKYPALKTQLESQIQLSMATTVGGVAPNFEQPNPDGEVLSLEGLRGKVVLIDFWASWCGPCRRENPNVVAAYNEFKDRGFEILGVSLDRDRNKWLNAIEADGLTWLHVSDLKGWQNEVAKLYGVRSIPHTILLDQEGRIIARNLRGPALEAKLQEVLGE